MNLAFLDYTERGNLLDGFLHEFLLAFLVIFLTGLIGLFLGWLMWRKSHRRYEEIRRENERIRAKQSRI